MAADLESARRDWDDAYRRLLEAERDPAQAERLRAQLEVVTSELRKRVGGAFTLLELQAAYRDADVWAREALAERTAWPGWSHTLAIVEGAAFHLYSRGALDFEP